MSDCTLITIAVIFAAYKLASQWLDSHDTGTRESDTYSSTETAPHESYDDSERSIPDIRLGFRRNDD